MTQDKHTSIRLDKELDARINDLAGRLDRSASWVIREAIKCGLRTMEHSAGKPEQSD